MRSEEWVEGRTQEISTITGWKNLANKLEDN